MAASESFEGRSCSIAESATVIARLYRKQNEQVRIIAEISKSVSDLSQNGFLIEQGLILPRQHIRALYANIPTHTCSVHELINALIKKNEALDEEIRITKAYIEECDRRMVVDGTFD